MTVVARHRGHVSGTNMFEFATNTLIGFTGKLLKRRAYARVQLRLPHHLSATQHQQEKGDMSRLGGGKPKLIRLKLNSIKLTN